MDLTRTDHGRDAIFGFLDRQAISPRVHHPRLIANEGRDTMLRAILHELRRSESFVFSVAFVTPGAVAALRQALLDFGGHGTIITSTYLQFNSPAAFEELLNLPRVDVRLLDNASEGFHAKGYLFRQRHSATAIIGSSNLTESALQRNHEWNLRFSALADGDIVHQLDSAVARQVQRSVPLDQQWVQQYRATWTRPAHTEGQRPGPGPNHTPIRPNTMQLEALGEIDLIRSRGERSAVVISATGTGKTILAALDVRAVSPRRMLFVVHREQILDRAMEEFRRVLGQPQHMFGKIAGGRRELDRRYVFATIQSLSRPGLLSSIRPDAFDYVLIDEVHKAGAATYRRLLQHLKPEFLLGMTATPERTDGENIFELFDHNVAYEIRLQKALEADMLAPFHYYGVTDYVTADGQTIDDLAALERLVAPERVQHLLSAIDRYGQRGVPVRGLIFCSRRDEAHRLSALLNQRDLRGHRLRTRALTGEDPVASREEAVTALENGELDYLLTVDIFNEGIDVPSVNQVVMLRQTQSSIVFTQQLGRGLRKCPGKDYLVVIDFIGNYANNYLIPIALFGDNSLNKDSVRQRMIEAQEAGSIAGLSSVNFDEIARARVFSSLAATKLDSMASLKAAYLEMSNRVGGVPRLLDFARFETVDPVVLACHEKNYWAFLQKVAKLPGPPPHAGRLLNLLTQEVMNGKRPHELVLLKALLSTQHLTLDKAAAALRERGCAGDRAALESAVRVLNLDFFPTKDTAAYLPVTESTAEGLRLSEVFRSAWHHPDFRSHVQDIIETGTYLARHRHDWQEPLVIGNRYSRKDVCRLLNWTSNQQSTIYGYKVDKKSGTCPIFVTYHKHADVEATVAYGDEFVDEKTLLWFTRSRRTLASPEVRTIVDNATALHLFVKLDDAEGTDFFYLGPVTAGEAKQERMPDGKGSEVPVVTIRLALTTPVERGLYDYLTQAPDEAGPRQTPSTWTDKAFAGEGLSPAIDMSLTVTVP